VTNPKPNESDTHVLLLARRIVSLPFALAAAVYRWVKGLVRSGKSEQALREEDQLRQSRVRRGLRGLPPDHVQDSSKP
jgi:hypothetical protein